MSEFHFLHVEKIHEKWIKSFKWIRGCLTSTSVSILIKESPSKEFMLQRGLRKGYPPGPFLFTIVAEGLSGLMREAQVKNLFSGFKVGSKGVEVNLLQYTDETIFVGDLTMENVVVVKSMLRCFELVSKLKVNVHMSRFGGISGGRETIKRFPRYLNCRILTFPFVYLGIPIGVNLGRIETWEPIIVKFKKKLASWKHKHLSFAERITLINSVLTSLPLFF